MKFKLFFIYTIIPFIFAACSATQQTTETVKDKTPEKTPKDSLYVFDSVPAADTASAENTLPPKKTQDRQANPQRMTMTYYVVQIGAFTTKEKADEFAASSKSKIKYNIDVNYNPDVKLFVVQLLPEYTSHSDAERVRNEIWQQQAFKDAWISTVQK